MAKVWIAVVEHRHGQNVYAAKTKRKLVDQLYEYVKQWWDSEIPQESLPPQLSKQQAVNLYFDRVGHEWLETLTQTEID